MACRMSELVIDCRDPQLLAAFWCEVLGYTVLGTDEDGAVEIGPPEGFGGLQPTPVPSPAAEPRPGRLRPHIDVSPTDRDQDAELARLLAAGARPADVGQSGEESWHVLADPNTPDYLYWSSPRCRPPPCPAKPGILPAPPTGWNPTACPAQRAPCSARPCEGPE